MNKFILFVLLIFSCSLLSQDVNMLLNNTNIDKQSLLSTVKQLEEQGLISKEDANEAILEITSMSNSDINKEVHKVNKNLKDEIDKKEKSNEVIKGDTGNTLRLASPVNSSVSNDIAAPIKPNKSSDSTRIKPELDEALDYFKSKRETN